MTISGQSLQTSYPCRWLYKVIGPDPDALRHAISLVVGETPCTVKPANRSRTGKYHSLDLELEVADEENRNRIYRRLQRQGAVVLVL